MLRNIIPCPCSMQRRIQDCTTIEWEVIPPEGRSISREELDESAVCRQFVRQLFTSPQDNRLYEHVFGESVVYTIEKSLKRCYYCNYPLPHDTALCTTCSLSPNSDKVIKDVQTTTFQNIFGDTGLIRQNLAWPRSIQNPTIASVIPRIDKLLYLEALQRGVENFVFIGQHVGISVLNTRWFKFCLVVNARCPTRTFYPGYTSNHYLMCSPLLRTRSLIFTEYSSRENEEKYCHVRCASLLFPCEHAYSKLKIKMWKRLQSAVNVGGPASLSACAEVVLYSCLLRNEQKDVPTMLNKCERLLPPPMFEVITKTIKSVYNIDDVRKMLYSILSKKPSPMVKKKLEKARSVFKIQ